MIYLHFNSSNYLNDKNYLKKSNDTDDEEDDLSRSFTVEGGILTVADDLLKDDGKKFLKIIEKLAERRLNY